MYFLNPCIWLYTKIFFYAPHLLEDAELGEGSGNVEGDELQGLLPAGGARIQSCRQGSIFSSFYSSLLLDKTEKGKR